MTRAADHEMARDRLSRLSAATLQINESLDFDHVLQQVVDNARALTEARYGIIITVGQVGELEVLFTSGISAEDHDLLQRMPGRWDLFAHFRQMPGSLRLRDFPSYAVEMGLPAFDLLPVGAFLAAPVRHGGENIGYIHLARDRGEEEFTAEDEEILAMFAAHAALVIANARQHREERRARADMEALADISPVGVLVFDPITGLLRTANGEACRIGGAGARSTVQALHVLSNLSVRRPNGTEISLSALALALVMSGGQKLQAEEMTVVPVEGPPVAVLVNATPLYSEDGDAVSIVVTMQDMTAFQELERARTDFLGMVSHELRAPLAAIRGSASTVLDDVAPPEPAEVRQFFLIVREQADRMRKLISDLLDVARIQAGALPVTPAHSDVANLVDQARNIFLGGGGRNNLVFDIPPGLPPVSADRLRVVQVLGNLLNNAAQNSPEGSGITVRARSEHYQVVISVTDEGRGIPAERLPQLFHKYTRSDRDEAGARTADTGLGLAICKGIVEAHGGRIWAESHGAGLGSRFTFTLPVAGEMTSAGEATGVAPAASPPQVEAQPLSILAVDDDPHTLRHLREALTTAGYRPIVTADPGEVHRLIADERPRLVLLDLVLPGRDGIELMRDIHEAFDVPVIFLSAYGREETIAKVLEMGAVDYVVKPFAGTELAARIGSALRRQAQSVNAEPYVVGDLVVDHARRSATVAGRWIALTPTEHRLLAELASNGGRAVTYAELLYRVWGAEPTADLRPVRTVIKNLRRKLGEAPGGPRYIFTEPRVGYRMAGPEPPDC